MNKPLCALQLDIRSSINESKLMRALQLSTTEQAQKRLTFLHIYTDPQTGVVTEVIRNRNMRSRYR